MIRYEALVLTVPTITQDETRTLESHLERVVKENKGSMISFEKWGKYRLAYPVNKNDYGVYFLARFETEKANQIVNDVKTLMAVKLESLVMRDIVTALEPKQTLEYHRPQSLEETPAREMGGFMQDRRDGQSFDAQAREDEMDLDLDQEDKE